jgi:dipeptidyl aminopeptidase/acylaminoacyl peptidase
MVGSKTAVVYELLKQSTPHHIQLLSSDREATKFTALVTTEERGHTYYFVDTARRLVTVLAEDAIARYRELLARTTAVAFKARDGLTIHGYMTLPTCVTMKKHPLVLLVHGGPFAQRTYWTFNPQKQLWANRGYAVLDVNYRGSGGYGKAFAGAGEGEVGGKIHEDLLDAVRWAIAEGFADPRKVVIMGASFGGYAALYAATTHPDTFAAAVSINGISDLADFIQHLPPALQTYRPYWHLYAGNPADPRQHHKLQQRSPLFKADQVQKPILIIHGAKDQRVKLHQAEKMVTALKQAGKDVEFLVLEDNGHSISRPQNLVKLYGTSEAFLERALQLGKSSHVER